MSTTDTIVSAVLLLAVALLVAGWLLRQVVDEVLYRRELPLLRDRWERRPRWVRRQTARADA